MTKYRLIFIIVLTINCAVKKNKGSSAIPIRPTASEDHSLFLVADDRPILNPKDLMTTRLSVAKYSLDGRPIARVTFAADGQSDYVQWQACPSYKDQDKAIQKTCQQGQSATNEILLSNLEPISYDIFVESCLYKERSTTDKQCGLQNKISFTQSPYTDKKLELLKESIVIKSKLDDYGTELHKAFLIFLQNSKECDTRGYLRVSTPDQEQYYRDLALQIENIKNLGPLLFNKNITAISQDPENSELAKISSNNSGKIDTEQKYDPGPLLLTETENTDLRDYYNSHILFPASGDYISNAPFKRMLLGANRFYSEAHANLVTDGYCVKLPKSKYEKLSAAHQLEATLCFMLLSNNSLTEQEKISLAAYFKTAQTANDIINAGKNAIQDNVNKGDSRFKCQAFQGLQQTVSNIKTEVTRLSKRYADIKAAIAMP